MRAASWTIQAQHSTVPPGTSPGKFRGARSPSSCWWARAAGASGCSTSACGCVGVAWYSTCGCAGAASGSGGTALARLRARVGLRWRGLDSSWSPKGPRPGSWRPRRSGLSGCGLVLGSTQESAVARAVGGSATFSAPYRWQMHRRAGQRCSLLVGRATRREKRCPPHPKGTQDSAFARRRSNTSALVTGSRSKRRSPHVPRTTADPCLPPEPQPETPDQRPTQPPGRGPLGDHPQRQPRQRTMTSGRPAAAHQHDAPQPRPRRGRGCEEWAGQRVVPAERRFWQASTTRAAMPASAALPQARGS